jgi:hypothetical protein
LTRDTLIGALMSAFVLRMSGLREIAGRLGQSLGTDNFSSLSPALSRPCSLRFVQALIGLVQTRHLPRRDELIALDSMAVTLPSTQRHRCPRLNRKTVGGGVLWAFMIQARRGICPVRILKVMAGAWNDSHQIKSIKLTPKLPVYLMDRGFFALGVIQSWLNDGVRFIVRSRKLVGVEIIGQISAPRRYRSGWIQTDAWVRLGGPRAKFHPEVRFIQAYVGKSVLSLVTSERRWTAERILDAYKKRQRIEQFHRFLKETIGLAHLYSFSYRGMLFLLHAALLLAMTLILGCRSVAGDTAALLRRLIRQLRSCLGLGGVWKRNTRPAFRYKSKAQNH